MISLLYTPRTGAKNKYTQKLLNIISKSGKVAVTKKATSEQLVGNVDEFGEQLVSRKRHPWSLH